MRPECRDSDGRGVNREKERRTQRSGEQQRIRKQTECWVCNPYTHWNNMCAALCCVIHEDGGEITAMFQGNGFDIYHQWVTLIICVVTVITVGAGPHTSLISRVRWHYRPTSECFPKLTRKHKPLCCRSPRWESPCNASSETCPAQTVVSCPAERKITINFILVDPHRFRVEFSVFT